MQDNYHLVYTLNACQKKLTGHIISAYCNCKAGEAGLCPHVGSLLFSIVRMKNACTSQECTWDRPRAVQRKPSQKRVHEVRFHSATENRPYPDTFQASACKNPNTFLEDLMDGLGDINPGCVLYKNSNSKSVDVSSFCVILNQISCMFVSQ